MKRLIEFNTVSYRRVFHDVIDRLEGDDWHRVPGKSFVCINCHSFSEPSEVPPFAKRIFYCGVHSADQILALLRDHEQRCSQDIVFVVKLSSDNLYQFNSSILGEAQVLFILEYWPETWEDRFHAFNLFHQILEQRQLLFASYYCHRIVEALTGPPGRAGEIPRLDESIGIASLVFQFRRLVERLLNKLDLYHFVSRFRARLNALWGKRRRKNLNECTHALITGWYGTETAGDKAILLELVNVLRENNPQTRFSITSIVPPLSRMTNYESGMNAEILELRQIRYRDLKTVDLVVFGGGPLMDSSQLKYIATLFDWAKRRGVETLLFGCGIGPLKSSIGTQRVKSILRRSDHAFFRDEESALMASKLGYDGPIQFACDPAFRYVHRWKQEKLGHAPPAKSGRLVGLLRAQTTEYTQAAADVSEQVCAAFVRFLGDYFRQQRQAEAELLSMHTFWLGNDDREVASRIAVQFDGQWLTWCREPQTLDGLLSCISNAGGGFAMRYHGHIFLLVLQIPFVSIDYSGKGGKVRNLVERYGLTNYSISTDEQITPEVFVERWRRVEENDQEIRSLIDSQVAADLQRLEELYCKLWTTRR
jgi:polysaccharide pyruvyl transferase WcaK-like protein